MRYERPVGLEAASASAGTGRGPGGHRPKSGFSGWPGYLWARSSNGVSAIRELLSTNKRDKASLAPNVMFAFVKKIFGKSPAAPATIQPRIPAVNPFAVKPAVRPAQKPAAAVAPAPAASSPTPP